MKPGKSQRIIFLQISGYPDDNDLSVSCVLPCGNDQHYSSHSSQCNFIAFEHKIEEWHFSECIFVVIMYAVCLNFR